MRIEPSSTSTFRGQVDEKKLAKEIKKEQPKKRKKKMKEQPMTRKMEKN